MLDKFAELFLNENETKLAVFLELYPVTEACLEKPFNDLLKKYPKINLNIHQFYFLRSRIMLPILRLLVLL